MIKFFRKIRQRLLTENKFSKYILYAIGEIVLVVVGILIALQLNIYNENQKNTKIEVDYLKGILNDLDQDIYELNELIYEDSLQLDAYTMLLKAFTDKDIKNNPSFIGAIGQANTYHSFDGNSIVFEDMKSSGKINFIKSDQVRFSILKYYKESHEIIKSQNEFSSPQIRTLADKAFLTNVDLNSLIEQFMFKDEWQSEIDALDFSFFDKNIDNIDVKNFANNVSMMKALVWRNHYKNRQLLFSSKDLKTKITDYLTTKGIEIKNQVKSDILAAIKNGDVNVLEKRVTKESIDDCFYMEDESGNYLVHSITYQSLESLRFFVEKGANLEGVCENKTPLMYAIKYGEFELVKYLVEQGADLKANNHGKTPLYYAKTYQHPEIEKYLIEMKAD
ncbi:MAG: DUF6090 family protein [Saprospiraceae bacterium]